MRDDREAHYRSGFIRIKRGREMSRVKGGRIGVRGGCYLRITPFLRCGPMLIPFSWSVPLTLERRIMRGEGRAYDLIGLVSTSRRRSVEGSLPSGSLLLLSHFSLLLSLFTVFNLSLPLLPTSAACFVAVYFFILYIVVEPCFLLFPTLYASLILFLRYLVLVASLS